MPLRNISIDNGLETIAEKIYELENRYILRTKPEDFNPEVPLLTEKDWRRNRFAGQSYALMGLTSGLLTVSYGVFAIYSFAKMATNHYGDLNNMSKNLLTITCSAVLMGLSSKLFKKAGKNLKNLQEKRKNQYNIPETD